jgi:tetratricopeptide (TPR) repeat protein
MKHVPQDKYNVAWFTLAECVARGERVRALGVYRLLSHSINNAAFARQLEGDILLAFQDKNAALSKYREAADLYQKEGKSSEAVAIYEHMRDIDSNKFAYLNKIVELYTALRVESKVICNLKLLFEEYVHRHEFADAQKVLTLLDELLQPEYTAYQHQQISFALIQDPDHDRAQLREHIKAAIAGFIQSDDTRALQKFLSALEMVNKEYAQEAREIATNR